MNNEIDYQKALETLKQMEEHARITKELWNSLGDAQWRIGEGNKLSNAIWQTTKNIDKSIEKLEEQILRDTSDSKFIIMINQMNISKEITDVDKYFKGLNARYYLKDKQVTCYYDYEFNLEGDDDNSIRSDKLVVSTNDFLHKTIPGVGLMNMDIQNLISCIHEEDKKLYHRFLAKCENIELKRATEDHVDKTKDKSGMRL